MPAAPFSSAWLRLCLISLLLTFASCSRPDDQLIRATIMAMKQEAEAGKWDELMSHISRHYQDKGGNNYFIINQLIRNYTAGVGELEVELEIMGVSVKEKEAQAQIKLVVKGKKLGKIYFVAGTDEVPEYPRLWFGKERGEWRLKRVEGIKGNEESPW